MAAPDYFEVIGTRGFYRPVAAVTFERALDLVAAAIAYARGRGLTDVLANTTGLTGFASPSTFERYQMAVRWAEAAGGSIRVALVARREIMDPQKIAVLMAQNRGVNGDVFTDEVSALAWLDARI
ncbi:MAG TPA: hypothetical protein VMF52_14755 [Steroidobacteraceae bacterium]|nr:hypothetical protein [Steroidobacteraceae bacterium]